MAGTKDDLTTRSRAAALAVPGCVLTGQSAAALTGNGPWDDISLGSQPWLIGRPRPGHRVLCLQHPGARFRRMGGLRVALPATAVVDLLRFLPLPLAKTLAYRALQTKVVGPADLTAAAKRLVRHAGAPQLRAIVADISTGAHADSERLLIAILTGAGLSGWYPNHRIELPGRTVVADVALPAPRLVIEVDGRAWHSSPARFQADRTRQNALVRSGWTVLRFTWEDLTTARRKSPLRSTPPWTGAAST